MPWFSVLGNRFGLHEFAGISHFSGHSGGGRYQRTGQKCAGTGTLTAFKIPIRSTHGVFPGRDLIVIHGQASGATRFPELKPGLLKYVE
jgi:hypothetical protein